MDALLLKQIHVAAVATSLGLFVLRGIWMLTDPARLTRRWVRIVPHGVDTLLLLSALLLAWRIGQYPFVHDWLTAKVVALVAYILLGTVALKRGPTRTVRTLAWVAALAVFGYIVAVARSHDPWPF
ncbi:MAG: SirB2 family protein [Candidatus Competibacterales bacterium]|nr:SirB2 family protein [Candidatus Competibacterales bacterium]